MYIAVIPNMAKWFFIIFIAALTFVMNAAAVDIPRGLVGLLYGVVAVNVFALSLLCIWLASYYSKFSHLGLGVIGHALVFLAAGLGFIGIGHVGLIQKVCAFPGSKVAAWASEHGACGLLSFFVLVFGVFTLWPSLELLYGITSRSTRSREKRAQG
jgi:hypothetical protein